MRSDICAAWEQAEKGNIKHISSLACINLLFFILFMSFIRLMCKNIFWVTSGFYLEIKVEKENVVVEEPQEYHIAPLVFCNVFCMSCIFSQLLGNEPQKILKSAYDFHNFSTFNNSTLKSVSFILETVSPEHQCESWDCDL